MTTSESPARSAPPRRASFSNVPNDALLPNLFSTVGNAVLLLQDWDKFGLSERVCYHFDLIQAVRSDASRRPRSESVGSTEGSKNTPQSAPQAARPPLSCGVRALLECVPKDRRLPSVQKRKLRSEMRTFNHVLASKSEFTSNEDDRSNNKQHPQLLVRQPYKLPLKINTSSNIFFAYESVRIALCVDASPTLTSTFGFANGTSSSNANPKAACPLDNLVPMVRAFVSALIKPIPIQQATANPSTTAGKGRGTKQAITADTKNADWTPELQVTVLAVYPRGRQRASRNPALTHLLVRDYRITDTKSAERLVEKLEEWAMCQVENEIASRLAYSGHSSMYEAPRYEAGMMPLYSSDLNDLLEAGDTALSTLSSAARPLIVLATDGRSVACDAMVDIVSTRDVDVPISVLDLSSPESHGMIKKSGQNGGGNENRDYEQMDDGFHLLNFDPVGALFPLHLSDDSESLYNVCRATGGCFFDWSLLNVAAQTFAGPLKADNPLYPDHFFWYKKMYHIKPNAVQWYILFSLSPLSPQIHSHLGKLPPPEYLRMKLAMENAGKEKVERVVGTSGSTRYQIDRAGSGTLPSQSSDFRRSAGSAATNPSGGAGGAGGDVVASSTQTRKQQDRLTFSTYHIHPVRIKGLLSMRIKEGYRVKLYGTSTNDPDKVSMQFFLPLDLGNTIHYELSYRAMSGYSHNMVGFSHIKIELSGEAGFIQTVKKDFLQGVGSRAVTMAQQVSRRLCDLFRLIRSEDMLQSYLCPLTWNDELSSPNSRFIEQLGSLTPMQRRRHFRSDEFDCVVVGMMPYNHGDDDFLSEFRSVDDGEQELVEAVEEISVVSIPPHRRYVKTVQSSYDDLAGYCVIELTQCNLASRIFTVSVETFHETSPRDRLELVVYLRGYLMGLKDVEVLPKQMGRFLPGVNLSSELSSSETDWRRSQYNHATWDLVKDPELVPLLMRRRTEIGHFLLLDSSDNHAMFAKLIQSNAAGDERDPGDLVQYQLVLMDDKVVVDLHMESNGGEFLSDRPTDGKSNNSKFHTLARILKRRDQECGRALQCRTSLLKVFDGETVFQLSSVQRLLAYASRIAIRLRYFHHGCRAANDALRTLTKEMFLGNSFGAKVAKLAIDPNAKLSDMDEGDWFLIEHDNHTMSIAHLSCTNKDEVSLEDGKGLTYRELTFFTIGVSDLYSKREDVVDDDGDDDHVSEYLCVTEFSDKIEAAHSRNYAAAAFNALGVGRIGTEFFHLDDFCEVLRSLEFVEVASVALEEGSNTGMRSKLKQLVDNVLGTIRDEHFCLYYKGQDREDMLYPVFPDDADSLSAYSSNSSNNVDDGSETNHAIGDNGSDVSVMGESVLSEYAPCPPVFVRFLLDGKPASVYDLIHVDQSLTITVQLSLFRDSQSTTRESRKVELSELPSSHLNAAMDLSGLLNAFISEQTLERLREEGRDIAVSELDLAKACLRRARGVLSSTIDAYFYVSKVDDMVPASAPAGFDADIQMGMEMLIGEILKQDTLNLKRFGEGFVTTETDDGSDRLSYWCFVSLKSRRTVITVEVYHPAGSDMGSVVLSSLHDLIARCCHTVNQLLLLEQLHRSRVASTLLLPHDSAEEDEEEEHRIIEPNLQRRDSAEFSPFRPGIFGCPVLFETSFDLFHRCATNPGQVARLLEATVLHVFAVSNRRRVFVYKDESGSIFYMNLSSSGGGIEADGVIGLHVYGVHKPGPSVTKQLTALLRKRLLSIAADMLSSVLSKNPQYSWKRADLSFVNSFETMRGELDESSRKQLADHELVYEFPRYVSDLGMVLMVLLYFRQNICGSTFFHIVNSMEWDPGTTSVTSTKENAVRLDSLNFVFYYNYAPSKTDPRLQAQSTLTEKGQKYARLAGTGIALIELEVVDRQGDRVRSIRVEDLGRNRCDLPQSAEDVKFCAVKSVRSDDVERNFQLRVKIMDTDLKRDILHEWVLLTLNQVLVGWTVERHLEFAATSKPDPDFYPYLPAGSKNAALRSIDPRVAPLRSIFGAACALPHPAVKSSELHGSIRASEVASVALDLLENAIIELVETESKGKWKGKSASDVVVMRLSRSERPRRVSISGDRSRRARVIDLSSGVPGNAIRDTPIDCPEYLCFYSSREYAADSDVHVSPPKLFEEVTLSDGSDQTSELLDSLKAVKTQSPKLFRRSFAFILSVKRNRRLLFTYNWPASLFKATNERISEKNKMLLSSTDQAMHFIQRRSLRDLSPLLTANANSAQKPATAAPSSRRNQRGEVPGSESASSEPRYSERDKRSELPPRRAARPTVIRRPKLVGKSVEGAAVHALAASRARASSNIFKGGASAAGPRKAQIEEARPVRQKRPAEKARQSDASSVVRLEDPALKKAQSAYNSSILSARVGFPRLHTLQQRATLTLLKKLWPAESGQSVHQSALQFLLLNSSFVRCEVSELLPLPNWLQEPFPVTFGQTLCAWYPGLSFLPVTWQSPKSMGTNPVFLVGETRKVRNCRCATVIRLDRFENNTKDKRRTFVRSSTWTLTMSRKSGTKGHLKRNSAQFNNQTLLEKDAAGTDKLSADLNSYLPLQRMLFDCLSSVVERSIKSLDEKIDYGQVLALVRDLEQQYSVKQQTNLLRSLYKVYSSGIFLASYDDHLIDSFEGTLLLQWLQANSDSRKVLTCGPKGLCFKREIVVRGTSSVCFLTCDGSDSNVMRLFVVCRTQGRNLYEFVFREGSNIAVSLLDSIAIEAAGMIYAELKAAALSLHLDRLWGRASRAEKGLAAPSASEIQELLNLSTIKPATEVVISQLDGDRLSMLFSDELNIDWETCSDLMGMETAFSPSWKLQEEDERSRLFYVQSEDSFLLITTDATGQGFKAAVVNRRERDSDQVVSIVQKVCNYLLHYIWSSLR